MICRATPGRLLQIRGKEQRRHFRQKYSSSTSRSLSAVNASSRGCHLYHLKDAHFFTPTPLVLGTGQFERQRVRVERVQVHPGSVLVIFTDGLKSRTNLKGKLDILRQPPIAIAEHLLENDARSDDDALVLVARFRT